MGINDLPQAIAQRRKERLEKEALLAPPLEPAKPQKAEGPANDLPTELLLLICDFMAEPELHAAALVCSRWNALIEPACFESHGAVGYLPKNIHVGASDDCIPNSCLPLVRLALSRMRPRPIPDIFRVDIGVDLAVDAREAQRTLSMFPNVPLVNINLFIYEAYSGDEEDAASEAFCDLLRGVRSASCQVLHVGGVEYDDKFSIRTKAVPRAISTLKSLAISTGQIIRGSLIRNWLLSSMKASQLVRLTLLDTMHQIDFAIILGGLRLPSLTTFIIDSNKTKLDTLLAFLAANPTVADLSVLSIISSNISFILPLPGIRRLITYPTFANHLLTVRGIFPRLESLYLRGNCDLNTMSQLLRSIARLPTLKRLKLSESTAQVAMDRGLWELIPRSGAQLSMPHIETLDLVLPLLVPHRDLDYVRWWLGRAFPGIKRLCLIIREDKEIEEWGVAERDRMLEDDESGQEDMRRSLVGDEATRIEFLTSLSQTCKALEFTRFTDEVEEYATLRMDDPANGAPTVKVVHLRQELLQALLDFLYLVRIVMHARGMAT
ncbi:uncharacterized protein SCHCODRAFT_02682872 [Schizophyllum commune H4-8]|uniref:F-box domain-containing protein n=1 Tax=Schizophyllum commune (strain H4-8 / FGSC 9210) TaxID=578458 RepID=D8PWI4_SCHCM|nr:uncharacterized protein SCHCODRAFT_02682872 [Schizophyllum commune H4-8]KAI5899938.1 hypothetical protein SCHCODRAFT_02682872 [Schizophyllum commune H4-8]